MSAPQDKPWSQIHDMLERRDSVNEIESLLDDLNPAELLHAVFSLAPDDQRALLSILSPEKAASLVQDLPDAHVADLIEEMPATSTAPIVEENIVTAAVFLGAIFKWQGRRFLRQEDLAGHIGDPIAGYEPGTYFYRTPFCVF